MASKQFGESISGDLPDGGRQTHELIASTGGEVRFTFTHPNGVGNNGLAVELILLDASGNWISELTTRGNGTLLATLPSAGTYYLQVRDADSRHDPVGSYRVQTAPTYAPGVTYDGGANNTAPTALVVPPGNVIRGLLGNGDIDFFKIEPDTGGVLAFHFSHPNGPGNEGSQVIIKITDEQGNVVSNHNVKGDTSFVTTVAKAGGYYVSVKDVLTFPVHDSGLYTMAPSFNYYRGVIYDGAANNSPATALALPLGRTAIGSLEGGDDDVFRFEANSGGKLSLNFLHPNGPGNTGVALNIQIVDSTGKQLLYKQERGDDLISLDLENGGAYFLRVFDPRFMEGPASGLYKAMFGLASNGGQTIKVSGPTPFAGTSGNDVIQGSTGRDTMLYSGNAADYDVEVSPAGASILDKRGAEGFDTLFNVERLQFNDKTVAIDVDGNAGRAFRLYQAAFDRAPDDGGFGFWLYHLDRGIQMHTVAERFIASEEFGSLYGAHPGNEAFVRALYQNVLHRTPDQGGIEFWVNILNQNKLDRADVLINFADSDENVAQVVGATAHGMSYIPWG